MWTGIRSEAIQESGKFHLWGNFMPVFGVPTTFSSVYAHTETSSIDGPRSNDISSSRGIRDSANTNTLPLRLSSVSGSLLAKPELDLSNGLELTGISVLPAPPLLGSYIQAKSRKHWCSNLHSHIFLV